MRVPLSWLKEYVEIDIPIPELAHLMTMAGLEVGAIEYVGKKPQSSMRGLGPKNTWKEMEREEHPQLSWENIYVGEITEVKKHPHQDNLTIATVDYGTGKKDTVTGAPNVKVGHSGMKVPLAETGAELFNPHSDKGEILKVKEAEIRGIKSATVICSEKELGISEDHTGVLILDPDMPKGEPLSKAIGDVVIELDLTPNLGRCLSVIGVAREVAALTGQKIDIEKPKWKEDGEPIDDQVTVEIKNPKLCSRYSAGLIKGVTVKKSPFWMRYRLILAGIRPVNNLVDITNYIMWEWGQPLHAFDYNQLSKRKSPPKIIVRRAKRGEKITTLDGKPRNLDEHMLLITDQRGPVAIAGVMGGQETEVTETTTNVLLESANFDHINNRRTSQKLKIPSEATRRFSKGLPGDLTLPALKKAGELIRKLAGGTIARGVKDAYPVKQKKVRIELDPGEVSRTLGIEVSEDKIMGILKALDFDCVKEKRLIYTKVPYYRLDVERSCDLVEEVARVIGYNNIPANLMSDPLPPQHRSQKLKLQEKVKDLLVGWGLNEVITYSLTNMEGLRKLNPEGEIRDENYLKVANPLTEEREVLRTTLMNNLLETVRLNLRHTDRVKIFEIGRVFFDKDGNQLPEESTRLSMALAGVRYPYSWIENDIGDIDFFDLKGLIEALFKHLGIQDYQFVRAQVPTFHPYRQARILTRDDELGIMGEVNQAVSKDFELNKKTYLAEIDFSYLYDKVKEVESFTPIPRFPASTVDIAVVVDEKIRAKEVEETIMKAGIEELKSARLFDLYQGEQLPQDKKSLAYTLTFQAANRTLTDEETNQFLNKIKKQLQEVLEATIRGKEIR